MTDTQNESQAGLSSDELSSARRVKIALIAVGIVAVLGLGYFLVRISLVGEQTEIAETEVETAVEVGPQEILWLELDRLPADLLGEDGEVIGNVFINVGLAVGGAADETYLSEHLGEVRLAILRVLASQGIGRQDEPLEIDQDRVAAMILSAANQALGRPVVLEVSVPEVLAGG